jgi:putative ABC transport system ATP-binding protein
LSRALIDISEVTKTYRLKNVRVRALRGVTLKVDHGEFVAIIGPSGSGKSTLMHILGCLDTPTDGTYSLDGTDIGSLPDKELSSLRNRTIGFVFQAFNLLPKLSLAGNVELPMTYAGVTVRERRDRALEMISLVGLKDRVLHKPMELSGGENQRAAIARALVNDPPLVLADEPTGNLDTKTGEEILAVLKSVHAQGRTVIIVTHDLEIADHAERIISIRDGLIEKDEAVSA